jgi:hydrogenase maturation protease
VTETLVVGYGSDLRGDDAAGRRVAEGVGSLGLTGVRVLSLHQLAPEVAAEVTGCRLVVFVDADPAATGVRIDPLEPGASDSATTHQADPAAVLDLAARLYGARPRAVLVRVPATSFELGADLSAVAAAAVGEAVTVVADLVRGS